MLMPCSMMPMSFQMVQLFMLIKRIISRFAQIWR